MAELVAGAFLSSSVNVLLERLASAEVVNWIRGKKVDQRLVRKMESYLNAVQAVLNDAERRQITDPHVKRWLTDLEDAVYVADDLLDEVQTKAANAQKHPGNLLSRHIKSNFQARKMVAKIEEVIGKLEDIERRTAVLSLLQNTPTGTMSKSTESSSLPEKYVMCGRDEDKEEIIRLLLDGEAKLSVIPIVGMGGIGKTTLAQKLFNADNLGGIFSPKVWVCVGEKNFDIVKLSKVILEKISTPCNTDNLDSIQLKLKDELAGKKFLLVLDDMWNISHGAWENFQKPFQNASQGSKIIVTTRNDNEVASMVRTVPSHRLEKLADEHCWSVFKNHATLSPLSQDNSSLEKFRGKIVKRCQGLPLAARTLGGLLKTKDIREWDGVLKSQIWEFPQNDETDIFPALRISYHYLPSYLKRCFVFSSLYPKDYEFDRDELILMWMAGDLLPQPRSGRTLEETGYECFNDLVSRSFFQQSHYYFENRFVMHDLIHDLAIFYGGKFYLRASEHVTATNVDPIARHVSFDVSDPNFLETFENLKHARTLMHACFNKVQSFPEEIASSISLLLSQLKCLRVLSIKYFPLDSLPKSIGELIHLRYLDLSREAIYLHLPEADIVTLPESLCKLHNLQTLKLKGCSGLKMLPSSIEDLVNLRHLDLSQGVFVTLPESIGKLHNLQTLKLRGCRSLKMLPSSMQDLVNMRHLDIRETISLKEMPLGMNKLKDLQFLSDYIVGRDEERGISQLGALTNLEASLAIHKLEHVTNSVEASKAKMIDKVHMEDLEFNWSDNNIADFEAEKDIFDKLQPCTELKVLRIWGYRGQEFPEWLGQSWYHSMTRLTLFGCRNCRKLPSLGQLPCLKELRISNFDELRSIGPEFYQNDECCQSNPFPSLETLRFDTLRKWQEWNSSQSAFPMLKMLLIWDCPMLTGDLCNHLPASLKTLRIQGCKSLELSMQQQQESLQSLTIENSLDSLTSFRLAAFPNLTALQIIHCERMRRLEVSQSAAFPSLSSLEISGCGNLEWLPRLGKVASQLRNLAIRRCPRVDRFGEEGDGSLPPTLRYLLLVECENLVRWVASSRVLHGCSTLTRLEICGPCDSVESFPREGSLPASLQSLSILNIPSLETLDCNGLLHLTSLRDLYIEECPKVDNIVGESLPASLEQLCISGSPLLGKRCLEQDQQIWPKIYHIPKVHLDRTHRLGGAICDNYFPGSYNGWCPDGYLGNGRNDGTNEAALLLVNLLHSKHIKLKSEMNANADRKEKIKEEDSCFK